MSMLQNNSRIENINGLHFYEQDVVMMDYVYTNNIKIITEADYRYPGLGIVLAEYKNDDMGESNNVFLLRIGNIEWSMINTSMDKQSKVAGGSCPLAPAYTGNKIKLIFIKSGKNIKLYFDNNTNKLVELAEYALKDDIDNFRIGFYSNKGNTIYNADIYDDRPQFWFTNIKNSNGGRISFKRDTVKFEHGDKAMEVEQEKILLYPGKYYLDYNISEVAKKSDIKCFLIPAQYSLLEIDAKKKSILNKDNSFTVKEIEDAEEQGQLFNLLFQCKHGTVSNICIKDHQGQSYVSTDGDSAITKDGSKIIVHLKDIAKIRWTGVIENIPEFKASEEIPYYIIKYGESKSSKEEFGIKLNTEYHYIFERYNNNTQWKFSVNDDNENLNTSKMYDNSNDIDIMEFFNNIQGYVQDIIITLQDGTEINILLQKTYKKYVPIEIQSPVIVVDENENPFDLSSSYRYSESSGKYIFTNWEREYFNGNSEKFTVENKILDSSDSCILYGIKRDIDLNKIYNIKNNDAINDISLCASSYDIISSEYFTITNKRVIEINKSIYDKKYQYFIIDYLKDDSYCINAVEDNNKNEIYEIDISTDKDRFTTLYDMSESGQIRTYKIIDNISPKDDYYITLKKPEEGFLA